MSRAPLPSDKPTKKAPPPPPKKPATAAAKKPPAGAASSNKKLPPAVVKAATANASLGNNAKLQSRANPAAAKPKAATPSVASNTKPQTAKPSAAPHANPKAATPPAAAGAKPASPGAQSATAAGGGHKAPPVSPASNASDAKRAGQPNLTPQEVQRELSGTGRKVAEIDKRTQEVLARPVDVGKAKRAVADSDGKLRNFYKQAAQGFSAKERENLVGLWNGTRGKRGTELREAQGKYGAAYQKALSSKQRQHLEKLYQQGTAARERQAEQRLGEVVRRAHQKLQEVQAKRHEQQQTGGDAKALNGQVKKAKGQFKAAQEDVRLFAAAGVQREADNKLLEQQRSSLSDSDHKALLGPSKELAAAAKAAQADPKDASKQARLAVTQANFDHALNGRLSEQQRAKKNELTTAAKHTRQAAQVVANEVGAQRELRAAQAAVSAASRKLGDPIEVQRRREAVAQARVALQAQDRQVRSLADQVLNNPACKSDLDEQYVGAQSQNKRLQADLLAAQAQHNYARAAQVNDAPVGAVKGPGVKPSSPVKSLSPEMKAANAQLIEAVKLRAEVIAALAPAPKVEKPSTLDRALAVAGGLGEVVGGVALGIATGASGVGLVAGLAIAGDGILRVGHAVSDWENDTVTDTPQSKALQWAGMSRDTANQTDAGIALGATLAGGGIAGAAKMVMSGNQLVRGAGWLSAGLLADTTQAQGRYALTGDHVTPLAVERLTAVGLDESRANALLVGASLLTSGVALKSAVSANAPGTAYRGFKQFPKAAAEGGTPAVARPGTSASALAADVPKPAAAPGSAVAAPPKPVADVPKLAATAPKSTAPASSAAAAKPSRPATAPVSRGSGGASVPLSKAPSASSSGGRTADWYGPRSPSHVREAVATKLAPNASKKEIAKLARQLNGRSLTVVLNSDGKLVAAAVLKPDSHGTFGRVLREKVAPNTTMVTHLAGDKAGIAQAVSAAAEGVKRFLPRQKTLSLVTDNPHVVGSIDAGSVTTHSVIRRSAPEVFANMPEAQRPPGVTEALTSPNGKPLAAPEQLRRLNEIPAGERTAWPIGTQQHSVTVAYDRPLTGWGKLVHPMHPDSYLGKLNSHFNPVRNIIEDVKYLRRVTRREPVPSDGTINFQVFPHPKTHQLARVATFYPKGTLPKDPVLLRQLAKAQVEATRPLGDSASINRMPEAERVPSTMESLGKRDGVIVVSDIDETGARTPAGLAALTDEFKGHGPDATGQFPFLSQREFQPGTAYLSEVAAIGKGGGNQAFLAAVDAARAAGAREMVFHTQGEGAVQMYNRAGAHVAGQPAPEGARLPNLIVTHARFGTGAAKVLKNELSLPEAQRMIPQELLQAVKEKTLPELQQHLEGLGDQLQDMSARVRGGALLTSYRLVYSPSSRSQAMRWAVEDASRPAISVVAATGTKLKDASRPAISAATATGARLKTAGQRSWEAAGQRLDQLKRPVNSALDRLKQPANAANLALNPYALPHGIEPGPLRGKLQTAGYAAQFLAREGWKTAKATLAVSAAAQAAVGLHPVKKNDDDLIRPFNGKLGSESFGVYFPLTGTTVVAWRTGSNARGPWPLDENGLMPLARVSAPMTDPKGPKGAGFLSAARWAPFGEVNAGIRWFGSNSGSSALSAVSWRPMPVNFNLRGDVPVQKGAATNLSALGSITALMPSVSHAFYWGRGGVVVRNLHVTMGGSLQTAALSPAARASSLRAGNHYTLGSNGVAGGTGLFFTLNAAYGHPDPSFYD